ncbi:hypothetical protein K8R14_00655 [bacterium]|nr:hypothetical protein [bacterium]
MDKNSKSELLHIEELYDFRKNIPAYLSKQKIKEVWGLEVDGERYKGISDKQRNIILKKVCILEDSLSWVLFRPFVRFVGISGSIASEFVKGGDDIDLFIVTRNDVVWIYRLFLYVRNVFERRVRLKRRVLKVKDKLCINFLTEERNLVFEEDIFNLNELLFLKPIFNKDFLSVIFLQNNWLKERFLVSESFLKKGNIRMGMLRRLTKRNYLLFLINLFCFCGQLSFMLLMRHRPDVGRLFRGFREGRIEFFPSDFKKKILSKG